jgi:hypothetical protein
MEPDPNRILYPLFAMFLLTGAVLLRMAQLRVGAVQRREIALEYYATFQNAEEPAHIRVVTRNFLNLFEVPVLFYVIVILIHITHHVSPWLVGCAWTYVALRCAHTWIHLTSNPVNVRFGIYFASNAVLTLMWGTLFLQLWRAG